MAVAARARRHRHAEAADEGQAEGDVGGRTAGGDPGRPPPRTHAASPLAPATAPDASRKARLVAAAAAGGISAHDAALRAREPRQARDPAALPPSPHSPTTCSSPASAGRARMTRSPGPPCPVRRLYGRPAAPAGWAAGARRPAADPG